MLISIADIKKKNQPRNVISCHKGQADIYHSKPLPITTLNQENARKLATENNNIFLILRLNSDLNGLIGCQLPYLRNNKCPTLIFY